MKNGNGTAKSTNYAVANTQGKGGQIYGNNAVPEKDKMADVAIKSAKKQCPYTTGDSKNKNEMDEG